MKKPAYRRQLGERIRSERKLKGLSQELLAEKANMHPNTVGRFERGEMEATVGAILKMAKALDLAPGELLNDLEPPRP